MGVDIDLRMNPARMDSKRWDEAFADAMKISRYGQLSMRVKREQDGIAYYCNALSVPRAVHGGAGDNIEWCVTGDLLTGNHTEDYILKSKLKDYGQGDVGHTTDILATELQDAGKYHLTPPKMVNVWGGKAQGERTYIYLLAIGCLICDRFPDAVLLDGTMDYEQCVRAVEIADEVLGTHLSLPVNYDAERLYPRIKEMAGGNEHIALELFEGLYQGIKGRNYLRFVVEHFSENCRYIYYRNNAVARGLYSTMREWLESGGDFEPLCRMLLTDEDGPRIDTERLIEAVVDAKLHEEEKLTFDCSENLRGAGQTENLRMQYIQVYADMAGAADGYIDRYLPMEELRAAFRRMLGNQCDADRIFDEKLELARTDQDKVLRDMLYNKEHMEKCIAKKMKEDAQYDITGIKEFYYWNTKADRVAPKLDEVMLSYMKSIDAFGRAQLKNFSPLSYHERLKYIAEFFDRRIVMCEDSWKKILSGLLEDEYMCRFLGLYSIDIQSLPSCNLVCVLAANYALFEHYWNRYSERGCETIEKTEDGVR